MNKIAEDFHTSGSENKFFEGWNGRLRWRNFGHRGAAPYTKTVKFWIKSLFALNEKLIYLRIFVRGFIADLLAREIFQQFA